MKKLLLLLAFFFTLISPNNLRAQITYLNAIESHNNRAIQMIISPDNMFAYVVTTHEVQAYQRNPANGQLTFLSALSQMSAGVPFYDIANLTLSPDAKFIYVQGIFDAYIFSRDSLTGLITPFQTLIDGYSPGTYPTTNNNIVVSNNGRHIYITGGDNLAIYKRDVLTDSLSLVDTMQNLNYVPSFAFESSIMLSSDNRLAFITSGHSISVYSRDSITGELSFKNIITGNNYVNQGLTYSCESVISSDDRFIYTTTVSQGSGALVVLSRDTVTDSLSIIQTLYNNIRPHFINITSDNKLISVSSGAGFGSPTPLLFFEADSATGKVRFISAYGGNSLQYCYKKCIDTGSRYFYACPAFIDSIYVYRFRLFLDSAINICYGDSAKLQPWGNYISYLWSTGSTNSSITVNAPGIYFLTAEDKNGNVFSDSIFVNLQPPPPVTLGKDITLYLGQSIGLYAGYYYTSWQWNINNDTLSYLYLKNDSVFFGTKMIIVTVTNSYNCTNSDTILITFSPNPAPITSTIQSDVFVYPNPFSSQAVLQAVAPLHNADLIIYNPLGQVVKQIKNISGQTVSLSCDNLPNGMYFYRFADNTNIFSGNFLIMHFK
ncbi:MAG: T9SS type A sorting domain-containing protein [Bacteroidia bacterium]